MIERENARDNNHQNDLDIHLGSSCGQKYHDEWLLETHKILYHNLGSQINHETRTHDLVENRIHYVENFSEEENEVRGALVCSDINVVDALEWSVVRNYHAKNRDKKDLDGFLLKLQKIVD